MFYTLTGLALAPGVAIMLFIYWRDTHDREPMRHLIICLLLGFISVIPTVIIEGLLTSNVQNYYFESRSVARKLFGAFIVAAAVEEFIKFACCRLYAYPKKDFNEPLDGIVYMVMVAMGFATVENFMYIFNDKIGGLETGIIRMFLTVPGHACWAVFTGYFMGRAKFKQGTVKRIILILTGLLLAIVMHGTYDGLLFIQDTDTFREYAYPLTIGALLTAISGFALAHLAIRQHRMISAGLLVTDENITATDGNITSKECI